MCAVEVGPCPFGRVPAKQVCVTATVRTAKAGHRGPTEQGGEAALAVDAAGGANGSQTRLGTTEQGVDVPVTHVALAGCELPVALDPGEPAAAQRGPDVRVPTGLELALPERTDRDRYRRLERQFERVDATVHDASEATETHIPSVRIAGTMHALIGTGSVHTTAAACDFLETVDPDRVTVLSVLDGEVTDRDASEAANVARVRLPGTVESRTREGEAAATIRAVAADGDADLLVCGTRRGDPDHAGEPPGSTLAALLADPPVPVVAVSV